MPLALQMEAQIMTVLDDDERAQLSALMNKLLARADALTDD